MGTENTQKTLAENSNIAGCDSDWHTADIICGGFPCQDISHAGKRAGITAARSGLWAYLCGAIRMVRPKYGIVENVAALLSNGMDTVCGDLAEIGYDAEWHCIPASAIGAPHERDRVWIIAHRDGVRVERSWPQLQAARLDERIRRYWQTTKPGVMRVDDGVSAEVHRNRIKQCGNSVVPQIPEIIGKVILGL